MKLVLFVCTLFCAYSSFSFPSFISHGYKSCRSCHFNALGNGPLTDYGRVVGATLVAGNIFNQSDESLAKKSGFLWGANSTDWMRFSADVRVLYFKQNLEKNKSESTIIPMQADASLIFKTAKEKIVGVVTVGYLPPEKNTSMTTKKPIISREHYLSYAFDKSSRVYAGLMDVAFGLRVSEHVAFSRAHTGLAQNDQVHGALYSYSKKSFDLAVHPFVGNLFQDGDLRQQGASVFFEHDVSDDFRLGTSALYSAGDFRTRFLSSLHFKWGLGKGSSFIGEAGVMNTALKSQKEDVLSSFIFLQNDFSLSRGLSLLFTSEVLVQDWDKDGWSLRVGPTLRYYPMQKLEIRADLYSTRSFNDKFAFDENNIQFLLQGHLWL